MEEKTKNQKPRRLSKKQRGFIKDYVETGNATKSALNNYDVRDYNTARVIGSENLTKPAIINAIKSIAEQIPDEVLLKVHKEGLEAVQEIISQGQTVAILPDHSVRHKFLDSAYKLKGSYAPDRTLNVNLEINPSETELELAKTLNDLRRNKIKDTNLPRGNNSADDKPSTGVDTEPLGGEVQDKK